MSAYSTLRVSREAAMKALLKLRGIRMPTDEELGDELDSYLKKDTLHNFLVVNIDEAKDDSTLQFLMSVR